MPRIFQYPREVKEFFLTPFTFPSLTGSNNGTKKSDSLEEVRLITSWNCVLWDEDYWQYCAITGEHKVFHGNWEYHLVYHWLPDFSLTVALIQSYLSVNSKEAYFFTFWLIIYFMKGRQIWFCQSEASQDHRVIFSTIFIRSSINNSIELNKLWLEKWMRKVNFWLKTRQNIFALFNLRCLSIIKKNPTKLKYYWHYWKKITLVTLSQHISWYC